MKTATPDNNPLMPFEEVALQEDQLQDVKGGDGVVESEIIDL